LFSLKSGSKTFIKAFFEKKMKKITEKADWIFK